MRCQDLQELPPNRQTWWNKRKAFIVANTFHNPNRGKKRFQNAELLKFRKDTETNSQYDATKNTGKLKL